MRLKPGLLLPFSLLLHYFRGQETGITFAESTKLADRNRVFPGLAKGYLSQSLLERLRQRGLHLVNGIAAT